MKKSFVVAGALFAAALSSNASALDTNTARALFVDGLNITLGVVNFVALGATPGYCNYIMDWASPFNPNDVGLCMVREARTAFAPSCILNERADITSIVTSDFGSCAGFNLKGEPVAAQLILGEVPGFGLAGIALTGNLACPTLYPVHSAAAAGVGCGGCP